MKPSSIKPTFSNTSREEERWNALTHGAGILIGVVVLTLLLLQNSSAGWMRILAVGIFGLTFIWTYFTSTFYHAIPVKKVRLKNRAHLLDHTAIYLFIAGTYTPVSLFALPEKWDMGILAGIWFLAAVGVFSKFFWMGKFRYLSLAFYLLMGWMIVIAALPLWHTAPHELIWWMLAGGAFYSLGTIFFSWEKLKYHHAVWHLFVLAGSLCHFVGIYFFL